MAQAPAIPITDLDALLVESLAISDAKRAAARGSKLTREQTDLLEVNRLAEELTIWETHRTYAVVREVSCECGRHFSEFLGWYDFQRQRRAGGRRLLRVPEGPADARYTVRANAEWCPACLPPLPPAHQDECALLASLGDEVAEACESCGQTSLF